MGTQILVVDDDVQFCDLLKEFLQREGFSVSVANDPAAGMIALRGAPPDLVVLDVMLPQRSGFDVCYDIRAESRVPIIMLTARGAVDDRIRGLESGADDYLSKPFDPRELLARIHSIFRRVPNQVVPKLKTFGDLTIDLGNRSATLANQPLMLTTAEFSILAYLVEKLPHPVTRDQLSEHLRGVDVQPFGRSIDIIVSRLRQKLHDDPKEPRYVRTIWGEGYLFVGVPKESS